MWWIRWHRQIELGLLILVMVSLGVAFFSRVTPEEQRVIELEAGLEQLYQPELAHFEVQGRYFDPTDSTEGLEWKWMEGYRWKVRATDENFVIVVQADLDGDGAEGVWSIDDRNSAVRQLAED